MLQSTTTYCGDGLVRAGFAPNLATCLARCESNIKCAFVSYFSEGDFEEKW